MRLILAASAFSAALLLAGRALSQIETPAPVRTETSLEVVTEEAAASGFASFP